MKFSVVLALSCGILFADSKDDAARLERATEVLQELMRTPDKGIPQDLFDRAECVVVVPGLKKGAFIVGARYGKGYLSCRNSARGWSAPGTVRVEGGSVGFQIGGSETDVVMLVMNKSGVDHLLSSKFTLGGAGSVAAGPVGRTTQAETDATMRAEMLAWSRSRGLFAGVSLEGATLREDVSDNADLYGKRVHNREIIDQQLAAPAVAKPLMDALNQFSGKRPTRG